MSRHGLPRTKHSLQQSGEVVERVAVRPCGLIGAPLASNADRIRPGSGWSGDTLASVGGRVATGRVNAAEAPASSRCPREGGSRCPAKHRHA